ncbi:MAG: sialate O-acetylesterase [Candidatus Latescibacteria bacterium]|nr:sialate O-acetylesterase [Candidatus Latescibacterota bacterium]
MRKRVHTDENFRMIQSVIPIVLSIILFLISAMPVFSDVKLPGIFGNNMVLQQNMQIPIWGTADPGEKVTVMIDGKRFENKAGKDGCWMVKLKKMKYGGPYTMTVQGKNNISYSGILIGEVWICSGQSNMAWTIGNVTDIDSEVTKANLPEIRMITINRISKETPQNDFPGNTPQWVVCDPETVKKFSAVGFFFGKVLHQELQVPIGLIHSSWGGSVAEAWTSYKILESKKELKPIVENLDELKANYPGAKEQYDKQIADQQKARAEGKQITTYILPPRGPETRDWPSGLYNAMIYPMIPYAIKGVIWYQGESNSVRAWQYRTLFPAMMQNWRKDWKQGNFPFLYVQLANWETESTGVTRGWGSWPELREAQTMTLKFPKTAMAVTIDIGNPENIHPNNKWDVGYRLALGALHVAYKRNIVYSGPIYKSMKKNGDTIRINFDYVADGLMTKNGGQISGFEIAGEDRVFHKATANIEGNCVVVTSHEVPKPEAVRYGWDDNPECNLFSTAGLPASPFRTDSWPGVTEGILKP